MTPSNITKFQRWLDIIAYLVGRNLPVSADDLMRNVPAFARDWTSDNETTRQAARRKFERDKDELRKFGIPIRTIEYNTSDAPGPIEGYILERRDFYLPYLHLVAQAGEGAKQYRERSRPATIDIAESAAPLALEALRRVANVPGFPFRREARSAFRKLAFDLDPQAFSSDTPVLFMDPPHASELTDRLRTLSDALLARKRVTFRYHGIYRGEDTDRAVAGYGLLFQHGHWYLVGHDSTRDAVRVFRVARMENVTVNPKAPRTPDYTVPDEFQLDDYVGREAWELGEEEAPVEARIRFRFPLSLLAERNSYGTLEAREPDGSVVRTFQVHQVDPFLRWLLSLEGEAEVLEPHHLCDALQQLARSIAAAHRED